MSLLEHIESGYKVVVNYCDSSPSPREFDQLSTVVLGDRVRYNFGDTKMDAESIQKICMSSRYLWLPVYMYDHSGITINTTGYSCPWDSGQVGIIYISKEVAVREWGNRYCSKGVRRKALECLRADIAELDRYITNEVYEWDIFDTKTNEWVDGCGGFYCTPEETMHEAKQQLEYLLNQGATHGNQAQIIAPTSNTN